MNHGEIPTGEKEKVARRDPPSSAVFLLKRCLPWEAREEVIGDLSEEYHHIMLSGVHPVKAALWYWRQALSFTAIYLWAFIRESGSKGVRAESFIQDLRYGFRALIKRPGFTVVALLTLAIGIGGASAVFSAVNAILLRPLPYHEPERIIQIRTSEPRRGAELLDNSFLDYLDWREQNEVFEELAAFITFELNLSGDGRPEPVSTTFASASLFPTLGAQPAIGRAFLPEEDRPGADYRQVVISHGLWQRRFGADIGIIGQKVRLDAEDYTVVGVMPPGFKFPFQSDAWAPIERWANRQYRGSRRFSVIARLKPGVSIEQARSGMRTVTERLERDYPKTNAGVSVELTPQRDSQVSHLRPYLWLLLGAVFCVLLIACANVASLLLARAAGRASEVAIRAAIGATRLRLARQLLTENLLLSLLGGALGLGLAWCSLRLLAAVIPVETPFWMEIDIDTPAFIFTLATTLCASLLFGLTPAWRSSKIDLHVSLKEGGRRATGGVRRGSGGLLIIAEMALALALLLGAGLMIKSFWRLQQVDPGFNPENLLTLHVSVPYDKYPDLALTSSFYDWIIERLKRLPGVEAVGGVTALPLAGRDDDDRGRVTFEGQSQAEQERNPYATWIQTSPEYFRAMSIPLINGRFFAESDGLNAPNVVILNRSAAGRFWPDENPIGKRLKFGAHDSPFPWWTVVGVVGDVSYGELEGQAGFEIYAPYTQMIAGVLTFVMRSRTEPMSLVSAASNEIWTVDKDQALFRVVTMERLMADSIWQRRLWAMVLGAFAATAMALAAVGIYGVMSHAVSQRRHEIGVRLALGARPADVLKMTIVEGLRLTMVGIAVGVVSALILARALASLFYGVSATDPLIFLGLPAMLAAVALLASYIPARRAAKVDPMTSLRSE